MNELTAPSLDSTIAQALRLSANGDPRPRTLVVYRDGLRMFTEWCGTVPLDPMAATLHHIIEYRDHLLTKGYKRSTVQIRLACVKKLYKALQNWGMRPDDPSAGVSAPKTKEATSSAVLGRALPLDAARAILALPGPTPKGRRDLAMLTLMLTSGIRCGEVSRIAYCDLQNSILSIDGKGGKRRNVVLTADALAAISALMALGKRRDGLLFGVGPRQVERIVDGYLTAAGVKVPGRSAHALRFTYAILAVMGGAKREALGDSMGHSSLQTTDIYTRAVAQYQNNPGDIVSKMLNGAKMENENK